MQITLKRSWFSPAGGLLEVRDNPHTVPDDWKSVLPPEAKIIGDTDDEDDDGKPVKPAAKK